MSDKMITVGRILTAHGIKGQLKVEVQSDNPLRFRRGHSLFVEKLHQRLKITAVQEHNACLLLSLEGIADRNAAEALTGSLLQVEASELPKLPAGRYYYFQIEGMQVFSAETGEELGIAEKVLEYSANDVFQIRLKDGKELLLPALKSTVKVLDIEGRRMDIIIPAGLLD